MSYKKTAVVGLFLFMLVILSAISTYFIAIGKCPSESLSCDAGKTCVPRKLICDFKPDCGDGQDENVLRCGNMYGASDVYNDNFFEGIRMKKIFMEKFNLSTHDDLKKFCSLNKTELSSGCNCGGVDIVQCWDQSKIPESFPREVVKIVLTKNQIELEESDTFEAYRKLSLLDLSSNNISVIPPRLVHNKHLKKLYLYDNQIRVLPKDLFSSTHSLVILMLQENRIEDFDLRESFKHLRSLRVLNISNNDLSLHKQTFPNMTSLNNLFIDFNYLKDLGDLFKHLHNLTLISIRFNKVEVIKASTFTHLKRLKELRLSDNPIKILNSDFLTNLPKLNALYLDNLQIPISENLVSKLNVSFLSIKEISHERINFHAIAKIEKLKFVAYEKYSYCSMTPNLQVLNCNPKTDGISSDKFLLMNSTLRYAVWLISLLTCSGNLMVLISRFTHRDENRSVSMVIRNLAVSDFIMGIYLAIIGLQDARFRNNYHLESRKWIQSTECVIAGILSMISSEVSILILAFMCIERFLLISDPFGHHRLNTKNVMMSLFIIWLVGVSIAVFPAILYHDTKFYGFYNGGTCFPLFLMEKYENGWQYSAFVFIGINLSLLLLMTVLYTSLLFSIWRTRRATTLNFFDCEFAIRFFFIVLTDAVCWAPIIVCSIMKFTSVELSGDTYAWLVIFILPLNSAVNPLLYTFSTPKYRDQIYTTFSKQSFTKKHDSTSNQVTAADESQTKTMPLLKNTSKSSAPSSNWLCWKRKS